MPISSAARGTYRAGGGRFARPPGLNSRSVSRSTPNLTAAGHHQNCRTPGTVTPTHHDCGATRAGSYTFRARPMPDFTYHDPVLPGHARSAYRKNHHSAKPPYGVDGDVHQGVPFYPPSLNPDSPEAMARLQRIRDARKLYKTPATRKATAGSVDDLLKATKPDREPCSAVRHSHIHSERIHNLSASVPMHLHQMHQESDRGSGRGRRRKGKRARLGSNASGSSYDNEPLGRRAVSSEVFVDDEVSRGLAYTSATQTEMVLSTDSLNESVRSDAAVMTEPEGFTGANQAQAAAPVDVSANRLNVGDAASFKIQTEEKEKDEGFAPILETDRELQTTTTEDVPSSAAVDSDGENEAEMKARAQAELEELRKMGGGRQDRTDRRQPCVEEEIAVQHVERQRNYNDVDALMNRSLEDEDNTMTEPMMSSVAAPSSLLDSLTSERDVDARAELMTSSVADRSSILDSQTSDRDVDARDREAVPRTMRTDLTDLRHVEKRRSSLLKASGDDEENEYFLIPGQQSITSELLSSQDPVLDNRVAEWHHKSIFYQSKPIDGGAESEGIRVSAVQVSTTRVICNPNARCEPPDLPVVVSSVTYPMRQLYPLPNSNHLLSGPSSKSPIPSGLHITDSSFVYEKTKPGQEIGRFKNCRRDRPDGAVNERQRRRDPIIAKTVVGDLQSTPDVIPRARSPLEETSAKAQRPDHLNLVPNYPAVYLGEQNKPGKKPSALDFWKQKEAAYMKRNSLNTSIGHAFD